jgi:hypothetical protein
VISLDHDLSQTEPPTNNHVVLATSKLSP